MAAVGLACRDPSPNSFETMLPQIAVLSDSPMGSARSVLDGLSPAQDATRPPRAEAGGLAAGGGLMAPACKVRHAGRSHIHPPLADHPADLMRRICKRYVLLPSLSVVNNGGPVRGTRCPGPSVRSVVFGVRTPLVHLDEARRHELQPGAGDTPRQAPGRLRRSGGRLGRRVVDRPAATSTAPPCSTPRPTSASR